MVVVTGGPGVGKTTLAYKLPRDQWFHYSGDYRIGTKYLAEPILDNIKRQAMKVDFLRDLLEPQGVAVVVEALHLCMTMRGVKEHESDMTTSVMRGVFREYPHLKEEFFNIISRMK